MVFILAVASGFNSAQAQIILRGGRMGMGRMYHRKPQLPRPQLPKFDPVVHISVGYGFPNLDKNELPVLYNYYRGTFSQSGPITGSIDYQFNRNLGIGVLITHGKVSAPYYDYSNTTTPALNGTLNNWSFMLNIMRYLPVTGTKITPYLRTAVGVNSWEQNFTDANGAKVNMNVIASDLAYQVGLGTRFYLSKNAGLFAEIGYGKYIVQGGLSFKF